MSSNWMGGLGILLAGMFMSGQGPPRRVTLDEALRMFEQNNLELRLAGSAREEALGLAEQARAYPNPAVTVTHEGLSGDGVDYSESYFNASQRLEWPGRRRARAESAALDVESAEHQLAAERLRLAFEVKRAYVQAAAAEEQLAAVERLSGVFRAAERSASARYREGDLSGYDVRRLRIERARYEGLRASFQLELRNARLRLSSLILPFDGGDELVPVAPAAPIEGNPPLRQDLDEAQAASRAMERRPELKSAEAAIAAADAALQYFGTFTRPDFNVTGGYKRQSDGFDGYFVGVSLPIPLLDRRAGDVEAARARLRGATTRLALARRAIENDVKGSLAAYRTITEQVTLVAEQLLTDAGDLLPIARVSYSEGEMSLLELLDAAEAHREAELTRSRLEAEWWVRYYDLERALGGFP